jgi:hypothetical protein
MFSQNGISFGSGDGVLRVSPGGQVSINECCPQYRFHVFENRISSSNSRAGFFWNAANVNATNGPVTNVGVYGQVESVRLSGSNTLTNVGVYGMVTDADDGYGGVFELNSADSFRVRYPLQVVHSSSRPVVNGMGVGIQLRAQNSAGANQVSGTLDCQYTNITAGSESADFSVRLINNGTNVEKLRVRSSGELNIGDFTDQGSFTLQNTGAFYQNGGINTKVSTISSSTSIDGSYHFIKVDASGGDIVIILPPASTVFVNNTGITYIFKRMDNVTTNTVTVMRTGSDVIDGGASMSLATRYEVKNLTATGPAEWSIH